MITKINCNVIKVINILKNNGFEAYLVGGAVRDLLLNHKINDYDITTNAYPEIIKKLFNDYKIYDIGEKFGTIGVCIDDEIIEITTYRYDVNYIKHRKPNEVLFGCSLEEDLKRRDFTINAIAYDPIDNKMIDYYNGIKDVEDKIIKCVGDPIERFNEDALRIIRAIRFKATLGFDIESKTNDAIKMLYHNINFLHYERIAAELKKIICGKNFINIINDYSFVLKELLDIFMYDFNDPSNEEDYIDKILIMYHNNQDILYDDMKKLMIKKDTINFLYRVFDILNKVDFNDYKCIRSYIKDNNINSFKKALYIKNRIKKINEFEYLEYMNNIDIAFSGCYSLKKLAINGNDLKRIYPKTEIKNILNFILEKVIKEELENDKKIIMEYIKCHFFNDQNN